MSSAEETTTRFVAEEGRKTGRFGLGFYKNYLFSMRGLAYFGPLLLTLVVADAFFGNAFRWMVGLRVEGCSQGLCEGRPGWEVTLRHTLSQWSNGQWVASLGILVVVGIVVRATCWSGTLLFLSNGGRYLHDAMVESLARVRVTFFDENPTGRVVRRFSSDYAQLKDEIPNYMNDILFSTVEMLWIVVLVLFQAPLAALACAPCGMLYFRVQALFRPASRETQRLFLTLETPIWSLFNESVAGFQTIRAYGKQVRFKEQLERHIQRAAYGAMTQSRITRWLNVRLKLISEFFALCVALYISWACAKGNMGVGTAGFLMSLTIGLDFTMQWLTRTLSLIEGTMVSLERILEYRDLPHEAPTHRVTLAEQFPERGPLVAPVCDLTLENVRGAYRPDLPEVLKGIDVVLGAGKKIGIIGKTGAGKSTIFQALYRMLALSQGEIKYGKIPLGDLPIEEARSLFAIIPQDPHVFAGTVRFNLDRLGLHSDERLWEALRQAQMESFVRGLEGGLDALIYERGANLSVGERQLLCLARTLLSGAPVVLMDEPTSSVDKETDALITSSCMEMFSGRTMLVIAHRLETVLQCDEVVLVDDGKVVAQGPADVVTRYFLEGQGEASLAEVLA
jgi:ABC-type multidrug transport system fused ATPase/permease subunit